MYEADLALFILLVSLWVTSCNLICSGSFMATLNWSAVVKKMEHVLKNTTFLFITVGSIGSWPSVAAVAMVLSHQ